MKVKLLRELLVESNIQSTPAGTVVDMDDDRAKELLKREPALIEVVDGKAEKAAPKAENKMDAEPENKADDKTAKRSKGR